MEDSPCLCGHPKEEHGYPNDLFGSPGCHALERWAFYQDGAEHQIGCSCPAYQGKPIGLQKMEEAYWQEMAKPTTSILPDWNEILPEYDWESPAWYDRPICECSHSLSDHSFIPDGYGWEQCAGTLYDQGKSIGCFCRSYTETTQSHIWELQRRKQDEEREACLAIAQKIKARCEEQKYKLANWFFRLKRFIFND